MPSPPADPGVAVTAERRGEKLLDELFRVVLEDGLRERGEAVSTLFCTAPGIYRKFGYELLSSYDEVEVPSATLARIRPPAGVRTRRATPADFDAVREVYDTWAAAQNGPLTRRGPSFPADANTLIDAFTGVTLAIDEAGDVVGFASWQRGQGSGDSSSLEVSDLLALSGDAYRALWSVLGSFGSVVGQVRVCTWVTTSPGCRSRRRTGRSRREALHAAGPRARAPSRPATGRRRRRLVPGGGGHVVTTNGTWHLVIDQGKAICTPTAAEDVRPHPRRARAGLGRRRDLRQPAHAGHLYDAATDTEGGRPGFVPRLSRSADYC